MAGDFHFNRRDRAGVGRSLVPVLSRSGAVARRVNAAEMDHIRSGGGWLEGGAAAARAVKFQWSDLASVLRHRQLWGIYAGQYANSSMLWFFLTWFPDVTCEGIAISTLRRPDFGLVSLPFLAAFIGVIVAGLLSDFLVRRGVSPTAARKVPLVGGLLLSTCIIGANYVENPRLVVLFLSHRPARVAAAPRSTGRSPSLLAPQRLVGLTAGVFEFPGQPAVHIRADHREPAGVREQF